MNDSTQPRRLAVHIDVYVFENDEIIGSHFHHITFPPALSWQQANNILSVAQETLLGNAKASIQLAILDAGEKLRADEEKRYAAENPDEGEG